MSSIDDAPTAPGRPGTGLERRRLRLGDVLFQGIAIAAVRGGDRAARADRLQGRRPRVAGDPGVRPLLHLDGGVGPRHRCLRGPHLHLRDGRHVVHRARCSRRRSPSRSPSSSPRSRRDESPSPIATLVELLAAIPSVVLGLWGILVFGPWVRDTPRAVAPQRARLPARSSRAIRRRRGCSRPRSSSRS